MPASFVPCIVVPTFDHGGSVAAVVTAAARHAPVFVVDDGSRDDTAQRLAGAPATVLRHGGNRGKGAALRTAFAAAREQGFTHAVVLDADAQQDPADVPPILTAGRAQPDALVVGVRDLHRGNSTRLRRVDRRVAGFWLWLGSGRWLPDVTHGFRCVPIAAALALAARGDRYDYEQELLALWCWSGRAVVHVPVRASPPPPGVPGTHVRVLRDFVRIGAAYSRCIAARTTLPAAELRERSDAAWLSRTRGQRLRSNLAQWFVAPWRQPVRAALAVALGAAALLVPWLPARALVALALAAALRLPKMLAFATATLVTLPWHWILPRP